MSRERQHDSANKHVTGAARYIDDMVEPTGTLHAYLGLSQAAHGDILDMDLSKIAAAPGVVVVDEEKPSAHFSGGRAHVGIVSESLAPMMPASRGSVRRNRAPPSVERSAAMVPPWR